MYRYCLISVFRRLPRRGEGRWAPGNKPQHNGCNGDHGIIGIIRHLVYAYYTTITGKGVLLKDHVTHLTSCRLLSPLQNKASAVWIYQEVYFRPNVSAKVSRQEQRPLRLILDNIP